MNRKNLLLSIFWLPLMAGAQNTYINCDFSNGIPKSFTQVDGDNNEPSTDMKAIGFERGKGWIDYVLTKENNNRVACSTSWYSPAGTSDDWLITPAFTVGSSEAVANWVAKAADKRHRDGYTVYVSTAENASTDNFDRQKPLFTVSQEEPEWTHHSVSLADYAGKRIRLAFVNNSTNQSRLYLDDIFVGIPSSLYMLVDIPEVSPTDNNIPIKGEVYTNETTPIDGFDAGFSCDGNTFVQHFDSIVAPGNKVAFQMDKTLTLQPYL